MGSRAKSQIVYLDRETRSHLLFVSATDCSIDVRCSIYNKWLKLQRSIMDSLTERVVKRFLSCTLPKQEWTHEAHLRVGLWHLLHYSPSESMARLRQSIKRYNIACGIENTDSQGYHETITRFYVLLIAHFIKTNIQLVNKIATAPLSNETTNVDLLADELINCYGNKSLIFKYYSRDRLMSKAARLEWVEPDLISIRFSINTKSN